MTADPATDEHADIVLSRKEFPKLGTVTIINGDTGQAI